MTTTVQAAMSAAKYGQRMQDFDDAISDLFAEIEGYKRAAEQFSRDYGLCQSCGECYHDYDLSFVDGDEICGNCAEV